MKELDKIWVNTDTLDGYYISNHPPCGEEYIRADALLGWAKEQASITEKLNGKGAMLKAWNTLIDKLNSM
jgi:hypothetical protein